MPISGELIAGALTGLAFVGCSLSNAPTPQTPGSAPRSVRRRDVVVNGKRVTTVDIHAHTIVPEAASISAMRSETFDHSRPGASSGWLMTAAASGTMVWA